MTPRVDGRVERRRRDAAAWAEWVARILPDYTYYIDIVGTCNLRCPSCAVGNSVPQAPKSLMSIEMFESILDKIAREHPGERIDIELYIWGEPVLHKRLPQFIAAARSRAMTVGISCNLNLFPRLREVVKAGPTIIRVSLSGYTNAAYRIGHAGGDVNAVKANLHHVRHHLDEVGTDALVQVFYHVYRHNVGEELDAMRRLCAELDFLFEAFVATLRPVEKTIDAMHGRVAPGDRAIVDAMAFSMADASRLAVAERARHPEKHADCMMRAARGYIGTDGSVPLCGLTYDSHKIIAASFLDTPREELRQRRYAHPFCKECMAVGADLTLCGAVQDALHHAAIETLGPSWADYVAGR